MTVSFINLSEIQSANRLDAEYFSVKHLRLHQKMKKVVYKPLRELCEFIQTGPSGSVLPSSGYTTSGIKVIRPSNLNGWSCDKGNFVYIPKSQNMNKNIKQYNAGDILITRIGDLKFGIIEEANNTGFAISPNLVALRTKRELLDPFFLLAFLNSEFGFSQIHRGTKIISLASVPASFIAGISVPLIPLIEQLKISNLVKNALKNQKKAQNIYAQAESLLFQTVQQTKMEKNQLSAVLNLSQIHESRRADAEYFINQLSENTSQFKTVKLDEFARIFRGIEPGRRSYQKDGKLFLRTSNISKFGLLNKSQKFISINLYNKLFPRYQPQLGEILLVKDGKPGIAYALNKSMIGIISAGIVRLKLATSLPAEYVALCINSRFCQQQILSDIDGSLVPHWKIEQIKKLTIPVLDQNIQTVLVKLIKKSGLLFKKTEENISVSLLLINKLIENNIKNVNS